MKKEHRPLTHDERKAAEAAFQGAAFDPQLSDSARRIYVGISSAMANKRHESFQEDGPPSATTVQKGSKETQTRRRTKSILW